MIEPTTLIIGGILLVGATFLGIRYGRKIDTKKIDVLDLKEVYDLTIDFIKGGDDNKIDAADAILLIQRLEALLDDNSFESQIELFDEELEELQKENIGLKEESPIE